MSKYLYLTGIPNKNMLNITENCLQTQYYSDLNNAIKGFLS